MPISKGLLVATFSLLLNIVWVFCIPPLNAPDETAHLMAVMEVRKFGRLPQVHYTFETNPKGEPVESYFDPGIVEYARKYGIPMGCCMVPYESMQPPLYYVGVAFLSLPFPPDPQPLLYVGRLLSAVLGAATAYFIWAGVRQIAPETRGLALFSAGLIAILPQFTANSAALTNDTLVNLVGSASFYVWFRGLREPQFDPYLFKAGALIGLGFLAKLTALSLLLPFILVIFFRAKDSLARQPVGKQRLSLLGRATLFGLGALLAFLLIAGWSILRNAFEYRDWTGSANALKWMSLNFSHANLLDAQLLANFLVATFNSTIGVFGWTDVFLPQAAYVLALLEVISLTCLTVVYLRRYFSRSNSRPPNNYSRLILLILVTATIAVVIAYLQFNLSVNLQPQGRYLFLLLLPFSLLLSVGIYKLSTTTRHRRVLLVLPLLWLGLTNLIGLYTVLGKWGPG
ncbi:MAG: DUF2142 domain-containing protein [Chloroflexota bacterium]